MQTRLQTLRSPRQPATVCQARKSRAPGAPANGGDGRKGSGGGSKQQGASTAPSALRNKARSSSSRAARVAGQRRQRASLPAAPGAEGGSALDLASTTTIFGLPPSAAPPASAPGPRNPRRPRRSETSGGGGGGGGGDGAGEVDDAPLRPYVDVVSEHVRARAGASSAAGGGAAAASGGSPPGGRPRGRGTKRAVTWQLLERHRLAFRAALQAEFEEEWEEAEQRLKTWPRGRLEAQGVALFDLAAAPDGALLRDAVVKLFVPDQPLPFHALSQGDILLLSQGSPGDDAFEAVLVDFSSRWLRVALPAQAAAAVRGRGWRVDLYANTVSHERSMQAVEAFSRGRQAAPSASDASEPQDGWHQLWTVLSGALPAGVQMPQAAAAPAPWARGPAARERLLAVRQGLADGAGAARTLNPSQLAAIRTSLGRTLSLWQGPPGTGKTRSLLAAAAALQRALPPGGRGPQILLTAASNVAVDNLVSGLLDLDPGVRVVRLGQPAKVSATLRAVCLEALAARTRAGRRAAKLRSQAEQADRGSAGALWQQVMAADAEAGQEALDDAAFVAATCIGAGDAALASRRFAVVLLDEATQATEPASLVALVQKADSLILVGDPAQLPPTVKSAEAEALGLGCSLYARLQAMGLQPLLLDTQYRMHPAICEWPSTAFYSGLLRSAPSHEDRPPAPGIDWPNPQVPVLFLQCPGPESRASAVAEDRSLALAASSAWAGGRRGAAPAAATGGEEAAATARRRRKRGGAGDDTAVSATREAEEPSAVVEAAFSYQNDSEVRAVVDVMGQLLGAGVAGADIGVITPYNGQVRAILKLARSRREVAWSQVEVRSVDGFQGREKEVIVFSAVRSNTAGRVGFLADARRLNVALTRAKRGLVVVGDERTLACDSTWAAWLAWARRRGALVRRRAQS